MKALAELSYFFAGNLNWPTFPHDRLAIALYPTLQILSSNPHWLQVGRDRQSRPCLAQPDSPQIEALAPRLGVALSFIYRLVDYSLPNNSGLRYRFDATFIDRIRI